MIANEQQRTVTLEPIKRFEDALAQWAATPVGSISVHPLFHQAHIEALKSQLDELREEVAEYDAMRGVKAVTAKTV
jgi:hypothetical protein